MPLEQCETHAIRDESHAEAKEGRPHDSWHGVGMRICSIGSRKENTTRADTGANWWLYVVSAVQIARKNTSIMWAQSVWFHFPLFFFSRYCSTH